MNSQLFDFKTFPFSLFNYKITNTNLQMFKYRNILLRSRKLVEPGEDCCSTHGAIRNSALWNALIIGSDRCRAYLSFNGEHTRASLGRPSLPSSRPSPETFRRLVAKASTVALEKPSSACLDMPDWCKRCESVLWFEFWAEECGRPWGTHTKHTKH